MGLKAAERRERDALIVRANALGLNRNETLAWLQANGWKMDSSALNRIRNRLRRTGPQRISAIARALPEYHAEAIEVVRSARQELGRQYLRIKDVPPPEKLPADEQLTAVQRAAWERAVVEARVRVLGKIIEYEPVLSAYMEAAELRVRTTGENMDSIGAAGSAREVDAKRPPALTADNGLGGGGGNEDVQDTQASQEEEEAGEPHLVEDPDNPGTSTVVWHNG